MSEPNTEKNAPSSALMLAILSAKPEHYTHEDVLRIRSIYQMNQKDFGGLALGLSLNKVCVMENGKEQDGRGKITPQSAKLLAALDFAISNQ